MRVFRLSFALWWAPSWWAHRHRGWTTRRYWLARPPMHVADGHALAIQIGPATLKWTLQGRLQPSGGSHG